MAGPAVTVLFKNLGTQDATYKMVTANEYSTNANSTPKPKKKVITQSTDRFIVQNKIIADANSATASNEAICTATITSQSTVDFSWAVEFAMK